MIRRSIPPVFSPIAPTALLPACGAALGFPGRHQSMQTELAHAFSGEVILTDSGTSALVLALRLATTPGDAIAMPGYCCIDVIAAAIRANVGVLLYDVEPTTLSPDLDSVRAAMRMGARALVVAPLYGYPPDMSALVTLAAEHGVPVIEDSAQAAGGEFGGSRLGTFGELTILSFGRGKGTTAGSGGALVIRSSRYRQRAATIPLRIQPAGRGWKPLVTVAGLWALARPSLYAIPASMAFLRLGEMVYRPAGEPRKLSAAASVLLSAAWRLNPSSLEARRGVARELADAVARHPLLTPIRPVATAAPGYLRFAVLHTRGTAVSDSALGIMKGYPLTIAQHPASRSVLVGAAPVLPGAEALCDRLATLPTHARMTARDRLRLLAWLGASPAERHGALQPQKAAG